MDSVLAAILAKEVPQYDRAFPNLSSSQARKTSDATRRYNCIAWAAGDSRRWWWPSEGKGAFWPHGAPRQATLSAFAAAYATIGYGSCDHGSWEAGFQKIALYVDVTGRPLHAARQESNGKWSSKLGLSVDVEHELRDLEGPEYGKVALFMKRAAR